MKTVKLGAEAVENKMGGTSSITFPRLADPKVLIHGVSTRLGGVSRGKVQSMNLSYKVKDEDICVGENRGLLSKALGMDLNRVVTVDQIHSDKVLKLDANQAQAKRGGSLGEGDGLITKEMGVPIMIMVADCLPVLFYDPIHKAIGLAHAGWRGTVNHVAAKTLLAMGEAYGTKPEEVRAVLGPCIGACCYEVGVDVKNEFAGVFPWAEEVLESGTPGHWKLNLAQANARQLIEVGMVENNLIHSDLCTVQNNSLFYSHRVEASEKEPTGRMGAVMMLRG